MSLEEIIQRAKVGCSAQQVADDNVELLRLLEISAQIYERDVVDPARLALLEAVARDAETYRAAWVARVEAVNFIGTSEPSSDDTYEQALARSLDAGYSLWESLAALHVHDAEAQHG